MKPTITRTEDVEIDIEFPCFISYGSSKYKITDENNWVKVEDFGFFAEKGISVYRKPPSAWGLILAKGERIDEAEFNESYSTILNHIIKSNGNTSSNSNDNNSDVAGLEMVPGVSQKD